MSDAQHAEQDRGHMPRDDGDDESGRTSGIGDDRPTTDDGGDRPVRDRPAGPAAEGGQVSADGEITPGATDDESVPQDDVVEQRRRHLIEHHGPDGTESAERSDEETRR
jgi:hypothetical protein